MTGGTARRASVIVAMAAALAGLGCAEQPQPTVEQQQAFEAANARFERCITSRNLQAHGLSATATTAVAHAMLLACRTEVKALAGTAVAALGESAAEDHMDAMEAWVFEQARERALRSGY